MFERIKSEREALGLSQEKFAAQIGVSRTSERKWESGEAEPKTCHIRKMCKIFGCTADYLIGEESSPE